MSIFKKLLKCKHGKFTQHDIFDGDGGIVTVRITCNDCPLINALVYDVIEEQSIWHHRGVNDCNHNNYENISYEWVGDLLKVPTSCNNCGLKIDSMYKLGNYPISGWYEQ